MLEGGGEPLYKKQGGPLGGGDLVPSRSDRVELGEQPQEWRGGNFQMVHKVPGKEAVSLP